MLAATRLVLVRHGESHGQREPLDRRAADVRRAVRPRARAVRPARRPPRRDRRAARDGVRAVRQPLPAGDRRRPSCSRRRSAGSSRRSTTGFGEHDPGPDCDGLTFDEFVERHGMPDWESDPHAVTFPGGETIAELHHRVGQAVRDAVGRHPGGTIVVCCHGGVVNAVAADGPAHADRPAASSCSRRTPRSPSCCSCGPGRWRLLRYNDAAHLAGLLRPPPVTCRTWSSSAPAPPAASSPAGSPSARATPSR